MWILSIKTHVIWDGVRYVILLRWENNMYNFILWYSIFCRIFFFLFENGVNSERDQWNTTYVKWLSSLSDFHTIFEWSFKGIYLIKWTVILNIYLWRWIALYKFCFQSVNLFGKHRFRYIVCQHEQNSFGSDWHRKKCLKLQTSIWCSANW